MDDLTSCQQFESTVSDLTLFASEQNEWCPNLTITGVPYIINMSGG